MLVACDAGTGRAGADGVSRMPVPIPERRTVRRQLPLRERLLLLDSVPRATSMDDQRDGVR